MTSWRFIPAKSLSLLGAGEPRFVDFDKRESSDSARDQNETSNDVRIVRRSSCEHCRVIFSRLLVQAGGATEVHLDLLSEPLAGALG